MKTGFLSAAALLAALCLPTSQANANPMTTEYRLSQTMTQVPNSQMAGNAGIVDCTALQGAYQASGLPYGDSIQTLRAIDAAVKKSFRYRKDPRGNESWNSFADRVLNGERRITADCDDYALTTMALAICAGVAPERLDFATAQTRSGARTIAKMDHAIAVYTAPDGRRYVVGDTTSRPRTLTARDRIILKVSAAEIGKGMRMSWRSTIDLGTGSTIIAQQTATNANN